MSAVTLHHYAALQEANDGYWLDPQGVLVGENVWWEPLPENDTQPAIDPRSLILHSNAGKTPATWRNLWAWVNRAGNTGEPHFDIDNTGACGQFISVHRRADCNAKANSWFRGGRRVGAVSIETGDYGSASLAHTPWNLEQLRPITAIATCLVIQEGIACTAPATWDDTGIGYHSQYPEWSIYVGKTCPGAARIRQCDWIRIEVANRVGAYHYACEGKGIDPIMGWA